MKTRRTLLILFVLLAAGVTLAQRGFGGRRFYRNYETVRDYARDRGYDMTTWTNRAGFEKDVFTFVRLQYDSGGRGMGGGWETDIPESDLNIAFRLQQITSIKVNPDGRVLRITDPELYKYPFVYMVEPGGLEFSEEEVVTLRKYLLNGGFLMVDDFWGEREWQNFYYEIKRVFPDREPVELPLEHPLFHCVFPLNIKPQIPGIRAWLSTGLTYERTDAREVHYKGIFDDKGRMMAIICHNTDLGDGWEEEASNPDYFKQFSEKYAYPLGINIIFYAMTH